MSNILHSPERGRTHYDVLNLPRHGDWSRLSKEEVKAAYRRALLIHHPDKAPNSTLKSPDGPRTPLYSIDDIVIAYETLLDSVKRFEYNQSLDKDQSYGLSGANGHTGTHIGVEVYDLEDLEYDERKNVWSKSCRCGDEQGYIMTESDLEKESQSGEIYAGCRGCSLFIKVLFALEDL